MEIWKDIVGYEGLYQVSNLGRVKSLGKGNSNASKERILKPFVNKDGYLHVCFYKDGNRKQYSVHRLVLMTFNPIEEIEELEVDHIDTDSTNNNLKNLRWTTRKENCNNSLTKIHYIESHKDNLGVKHPKSISIVQLTLDGQLVEVYGSSYEAERSGFHQRHINSCCRGERKTHSGYKWMFLYKYLLLKYPRIIELNLFGKSYERRCNN